MAPDKPVLYPSQSAKVAKAAKEPIDIVQLKAALDSSSDKNRNFLIAFLLVEFYLMIAVLGTSDLELFLAEALFTFPFIKLDVPLEAFYVVAPLVLLAFHFNLMFNLLEHTR
jgi:hypothetical protein